MMRLILPCAAVLALSACAPNTVVPAPNTVVSAPVAMDAVMAKVKAEMPVLQTALALVKNVPAPVMSALADLSAVVNAYQPGQAGQPITLAAVEADLNLIAPALPQEYQAVIVLIEAAVAAAQ